MKEDKAIEMSAEEASAVERLIQVGDPGEKLPTGETVGEYRERVKAAERNKEPWIDEGESLRRGAVSALGNVRLTLTPDGPVSAPLAPEAKPAQPEGDETVKAIGEDFPHRSLLVPAGFTTLQQLRAAQDEELLKIEGFGPAKLKEVRKALK